MPVIKINVQELNAGVHTFGPRPVPGPTTFMDGIATIPTADYETAGAGFHLSVQVSDDDFVTHIDCGFGWSNPTGGPIFDTKSGTTNPPPHFRCTFVPPLSPGMKMRAILELFIAMNIGFDVEVD